MSRSTATFFAYDLRPVKQAERRLLMDILRVGREAGALSPNCGYLGMGGIRFYDFEMLHRYMGIREMISLEQDKGVLRRCEYNKPFGFIKVLNKTATDYIDEVLFEKPQLVWLDYDWGLSKVITSDIGALASKLPTGSFVFVTAKAELPNIIANSGVKERVQHFVAELGALALGCSEDDVSVDEYPKYVARVLRAAFVSAFAARTDGVYEPLITMAYKDSCWMITVGGCFTEPGIGTKLTTRLKSELPFLFKGGEIPFAMLDISFTQKERALLDRYVTTNPNSDEESAFIKGLKFSKNQLAEYEKIARFLPRYIETFL